MKLMTLLFVVVCHFFAQSPVSISATSNGVTVNTKVEVRTKPPVLRQIICTIDEEDLDVYHCRVVLDRKVPRGVPPVVISLTSGSPATVEVPASVTVPVGRDTMVFEVTLK